MEMLIITLVVVIAFAAVLIPLFRRGTRTGDEREFSTSDAPVDADVTAAPIAPMAAGPATPTVDTTDHPQQFQDQDELELEVQRYRAAVRAGTICRKCGQANPADGAFCFECGARLPRSDAKEFE